MNKKKVPLKYYTTLAMLGAISFLLMNLEIPWPLFPFLKYDPSDIPAFLGTFIYGPLSGFIIVFLRTLLHFVLIHSEPAGHFADIVASGSMVAISGFFYQKWHSRKGAIIGMIVGALAMTGLMIPTNIYIVIPVYMGKLPGGGAGFDLSRFIVAGIIPFNLFKGTLNILFTSLLYKRLSILIPRREKGK